MTPWFILLGGSVLVYQTTSSARAMGWSVVAGGYACYVLALNSGIL